MGDEKAEEDKTGTERGKKIKTRPSQVLMSDKFGKEWVNIFCTSKLNAWCFQERIISNMLHMCRHKNQRA